MDNYEDRKVGRIELEDNNGVGVSTAFSSDEGYETALLDANGIHPVERYPDKESSLKGHNKWVLFANDCENKDVIKLGWTGMGMDGKITLERGV